MWPIFGDIIYSIWMILDLVLAKRTVNWNKKHSKGFFSKWVCFAGSLAQAHFHTVKWDFGYVWPPSYDAFTSKSHNCKSYMQNNVCENPNNNLPKYLCQCSSKAWNRWIDHMGVLQTPINKWLIEMGAPPIWKVVPFCLLLVTGPSQWIFFFSSLVKFHCQTWESLLPCAAYKANYLLVKNLLVSVEAIYWPAYYLRPQYMRGYG